MNMQLKSLNVNARQPTSIANRLRYALVWKQRKLMVQCVEQRDAMPLPSLVNVQDIVACLERSPVQLVKLDPALGAEQLYLWATACQQAHKPAFLCLPPLQQSPQKQQSIRWRLKRLFDQVMAVFLLLLLSPVWFSVMLLVWRFIPGSIFVQEYRVGERGKLFQMLKFRTTMGRSDTLLSQWRSQHMKTARTNALGWCLERYSLDELPQLINILRGEMSLVGLRPLPLDEAVKVPPALQQRLNALPGMTGIWQIGGRSPRVALDELVNGTELKYMQRVSLRQDLTFLLLTVPRVLAGTSVD